MSLQKYQKTHPNSLDWATLPSTPLVLNRTGTTVANLGTRRAAIRASISICMRWGDVSGVGDEQGFLYALGQTREQSRLRAWPPRRQRPRLWPRVTRHKRVTHSFLFPLRHVNVPQAGNLRRASPFSSSTYTRSLTWLTGMNRLAMYRALAPSRRLQPPVKVCQLFRKFESRLYPVIIF